jgi:NADPH-dependent methylglyoxal reductase
MSTTKILVTGANGFIASEIIHQLLEQGKHVVGTVRSLSKAETLKSKYRRYYDSGKLSFVTLNLSNPEDFTSILSQDKSITIVIHTAQPMPFEARNDPIAEIVEPSVKSVKKLLDAIEQQPQVKRLVFTSSDVAIFNHTLPAGSSVLTEQSWISTEIDDVRSDLLSAYSVAKKEGEKAIYEYFETHKDSHFIAKVVCPPDIFGPIDQGYNGGEIGNGTMKFLYSIWTGSALLPEALGEGGWYTDVRDIASAHIQAADPNETPDTVSRYVVVKEKFSFSLVSKIFREKFGDKNPNIYEDKTEHDPEKLDIPNFDFSETNKDIKFKYNVSFEDSIYAVGKQFLEMSS